MTPEERKIYNQKHYQTNKDKRLLQIKEWKENNLDRYKAYFKSEKHKTYVNENKEKSKEIRKKYIVENAKIIKEKRKKYNKENKIKNDVYRYNYIKNRLNTDCLFKFKTNAANLIRQSFKYKKFTKKSKTREILGCSYEEFKIHLESKFLSWMNWDNHGKYNGTEAYGWDIDHIVPVSSAITEEDIVRLNHYTNLQPLCSKVNRDIKRDN